MGNNKSKIQQPVPIQFQISCEPRCDLSDHDDFVDINLNADTNCNTDGGDGSPRLVVSSNIKNHNRDRDLEGLEEYALVHKITSMVEEDSSYIDEDSFVFVYAPMNLRLIQSPAALQNIFLFCGLRDISVISCVCRYWNQVCSYRSESLWLELAKQNIMDLDWFKTVPELFRMLSVCDDALSNDGSDELDSESRTIIEKTRVKYELLMSNHFQNVMTWRQKVFRYTCWNWGRVKERYVPISHHSMYNILSSTEMCPMKVLILGNSNLGKSALRTFFFYPDYSIFSSSDPSFFPYQPTMECDIDTKIISLPIMNYEGTCSEFCVNMQVWDCAGVSHEELPNLSSKPQLTSYLKGADAIILCYDATNADSFNDLEYWDSFIQKQCEHNHMVPVILTALKCDTDTIGRKARVVSRNKGQLHAMKRGYAYVETSAKCDTETTCLPFQLAAFFCQRASSMLQAFQREETTLMPQVTVAEHEELFDDDSSLDTVVGSIGSPLTNMDDSFLDTRSALAVELPLLFGGFFPPK